MLLHASANFVKHFKCRVSLPGKPVKHERRMDSWSAHVVKFGRMKLVLLMNDIALYSMIIPIEKALSFDDFALRFFGRLLMEWDLRGKALREKDLSLVVLKRNNCQLIGCMNDTAIRLGVYAASQEKAAEKVDWARVEIILNDTPFALLDNTSPGDAMNLLVGSMV